MSLRKFLFPTLLTFAVLPCASGQQLSVRKVVFRNSGSFQQADLESVAQMHTGSKVTLDQIRAAAQRLVDTGFFEDVNVDSDHAPGALTVIFILKPLPADQVTKAEFENFVWLTPEELQSTVHTVVPLFNGELPESGTSLDQIDGALKAALVAKGVTNAEVEHEPVLATTQDPVHTLRFRVLRPRVLVGSMRLEGINPALQPTLDKIAAKIQGSSYRAGETGISTLGRALGPYRDAGYLEARISDVHVAVTKSTPDAAAVDVTGKLDPGARYQVKVIHFVETPMVSEAAFTAAAKLHPGDVASRGALLATLAPIDAAYEKQGYADAFVKVAPSMDEAAHTVSYDLTVEPGEQYRVRSVNVMGLPPDLRAQFDSIWKLKPGELYDPGYVRAFLANNTAVRGLAGWTGAYKAASDPQAHVVDLMVNFVQVLGKN